MLDLFCQPSPDGDKHNKHGLPSLSTLNKECDNKWNATKHMFEEGILVKPDNCPKCNYKVGFKKDPWMTQVKHNKGLTDEGPSEEKACFTYRCKNRKCSWQKSVHDGTFFHNAKKPVHEILVVLLLWLAGSPLTVVTQLTNWSHTAAFVCARLFRIMVSTFVVDFIENHPWEENITYENGMIGGPGIEVQIDESAFGRRKYTTNHVPRSNNSMKKARPRDRQSCVKMQHAELHQYKPSRSAATHHLLLAL